MGPTHSISSAAAWLGAVALYSTTTSTPVDPAVLVLGTAVAAGAALAPDIDSHNSTVVNSLGIVGKGVHQIVNTVSVLVFNLTRTRKDRVAEGGHRTLFHTTAMALVAGGLTALAAGSTAEAFEFAGTTFSWGQVSSLVIMAIFLDLALGGLFEKQVKKARRTYGPYLLLAFSLVATLVTAFFLPPADGHTYAWLGLAVGFGWFMHLLGDFITKMGVPLAWPIRIRGKAWWDVAPPSFLRISAGGAFEKIILLPVCSIAALSLLAYNIYLYAESAALFGIGV